MLKRFTNSLLHRLGYELKSIADLKRPEQLTGQWLQSKNINTVIDAGGGWGDFAIRVRKLLPNAKIISYEIHEPSLKIMNDAMRGDKNFESHFIALNNYNGTTTFRISSYDGSSSLLPMSDLHKTAYPISKDITEVEVECKRLDDLLDSTTLKKNILIKLDLQGAEKLVLEGAENVLRNSAIIIAEINFQELYENSVLANELIDFLRERGFALVGIENVSQHPSNGMFIQADAWFQRV